MYKRQRFIELMKRKADANQNWYRTYARICFDISTSFNEKGGVTRTLKFNARYYPIIRDVVKMGHLSIEEIKLLMSNMRNGF